MITADDLVRREVCHCASSLVATLAGVSGMNQSAIDADPEAWALFNAALDLAMPIDDWEEAARENGWKTADLTPGMLIREFTDRTEAETLLPSRGHEYDWEAACQLSEVDPYQREVYEHWIVTDWLADKLEAHGEKVDKDFAGMCIWARTTTGQAIAADHVIEAITAEINAA